MNSAMEKPAVNPGPGPIWGGDDYRTISNNLRNPRSGVMEFMGDVLVNVPWLSRLDEIVGTYIHISGSSPCLLVKLPF
jgi:hypothetical protein